LNLSQLKDYANWIGKSPFDVWTAVKQVGGWQVVFPGPLPRWASRVRQFFNLTPVKLKLLDAGKSWVEAGHAQTAIRAANYGHRQRSRGMGIAVVTPGSSTRLGTPVAKPDPTIRVDGVGERIPTEGALSGAVYESVGSRHLWYQMAPGGGIYHTGRKVYIATLDAVIAEIAGQSKSSIFKLVCPDGTGGSREVIIKNQGQETIGAANEVVDVDHRVVRHSVAQGSYNYAETIKRGYAAHVRLDVRTDPMREGYYVLPPGQWNLTDALIMPPSHIHFPPNDPEGKSLAAQNWPAP
jgi:hypothetical protein